MNLTETKDVLQNHLLCLSGKMVSKPKQKDVIEALQIVLNCFNRNTISDETIQEVKKYFTNIITVDHFEKAVAEELKKYPFLKWQHRKTAKLVRKLFKEGRSISETVHLVILNN